ncbi:MAG: response regulator transcription factor, partial [Acidobacteriota bacterium]
MRDSKILVVEDEPSIREVVSLYLERAGFQVASVGDGQEAVSALERDPPDLVVLDLMLPRVNGIEITRWLRSRGDTPIIMLTARREEVDRIAGLEMGADDYVVKPFSPQELVSRVRAVLRRSQATDKDARAKPLEFEHLRIDPRARLVEVDEEERR